VLRPFGRRSGWGFNVVVTSGTSQLHRFGADDHDSSTSPNPTLLRRGDELWGGGVYAPLSLNNDGSGFAATARTRRTAWCATLTATSTA
jgi:hypothetical protein